MSALRQQIQRQQDQACNLCGAIEAVHNLDNERVAPDAVSALNDGADYCLAKGFHRIAKLRRIGSKEIPADIRQGDRCRAALHSIATNAAYGMRRTNEDERWAGMTLLKNPEQFHWSDREIGRQCGFSPTIACGLRRPFVQDRQIGGPRTVQRNGKTYKQSAAKIGPKPRSSVRVIEAEPQSGETPGQALECLTSKLLCSLENWERLSAALYSSTSQIRERMIEAIRDNS